MKYINTHCVLHIGKMARIPSASTTPSGFKGVIIINLDRRPDRWVSVASQLAKSDLGAITPTFRLPAHDGRTLDPVAVCTPRALRDIASTMRGNRRRFHAQLTTGGVGCYLSHLDAWRFIAEDTAALHTPYIVLEDDATVPQECLQSMNMGWALAKLRAGDDPFILWWHMICLKGCDALPSDGLTEPERFWSMLAYSLTPATARMLLSLNVLPMDVQIDSYLPNVRDAGYVRFFHFPAGFSNAVDDTDIQSGTVPDAPLDRVE